MEAQAIIDQVREAISKLEEDRVSSLVREYLDNYSDPIVLVNQGLTAGLRDLGENFATGEAFLPELIKGAKIFQQNLDELAPHLGDETVDTKGKLLIATVEGDIHDVGKNIVITLFTSSGFEVADMGINTTTDDIVAKVADFKPDVLGLSALLTTTMFKQREVIEALQEKGLRDGVKVIVGGAPCSSEWSQEIGADGFAEDAFAGLKIAERLLN